MPTSFSCPNCNAPLSYSEEAGTTIRCDYCGTTVVVPESVRRSEGATHRIEIASQGGQRINWLGCMAILGLLIVVAFGIFAASGIFITRSASGVIAELGTAIVPTVSALEDGAGTPLPTRTSVPSPTPSFAEELLRFGGAGIGPGLLEDARDIAVDRQGRIYAADYSGGRIQRFSAEGAYERQFQVDEDIPIQGLAVAPEGELLVVQGGRILRLNAENGELVGELRYPGGELYYHDVTVSPTGELVAMTTEWLGSVFATQRLYYELTWLDAEGNVLRSASLLERDDGVDLTTLTTDGSGNVYALGRGRVRNELHDLIYVYDRNGNFVTLIDGGGNQAGTPGSFSNANGIAVDGWGRIYVGVNDILVLDPAGRYLDEIPLDLSVWDLQFAGSQTLFAANRDEIFQLLVPEPVD